MEIWPPTPSRAGHSASQAPAVVQHVCDQVDPRASDDMHRVRVLAQADNPLRRIPVRWKVHMGELRDCVADALVDRAGDFAPHRVRERNVHVRARYAVAIVSKRSPTVTTTSGFRSPNWVGPSTSPW
jgi:hypothetical protein